LGKNLTFLKNAVGTYVASQPAKANVQQVSVRPRINHYHRAMFAAFRPLYRYSNAVSPAILTKVDIWRNTGEVAGFYAQNVVMGRHSYSEEYVWVLRYGKFVQVRQNGLRDVAERIFMGRA